MVSVTTPVFCSSGSKVEDLRYIEADGYTVRNMVSSAHLGL